MRRVALADASLPTHDIGPESPIGRRDNDGDRQRLLAECARGKLRAVLPAILHAGRALALVDSGVLVRGWATRHRIVASC
jgi:hypothetical protein